MSDEDDYSIDIISDIGEWLTFALFAVFSSTYYVEFCQLDRVEMNCFSKDYEEKKQAKPVQKHYLKLKQVESAESSDQEY